jgi:hypothetical protein
VLACLTSLEVAIDESQQAEPIEQVEIQTTDSGEDVVEAEDKQRYAAGELIHNVAQLMRVGVANAGVVVQSGLLRAVHQCRADGLHRMSALGLRVVTGISEFRSRSAASDPAQLADDMADVLETGRRVLSQKPIASFWIGTARRRQLPVRPRKLHGLFAEPILTRSGYSGAAAYFLGEDDRIYSASDVRPHDEQAAHDGQHARNAYLGGIEIGSMVQPAKQLARGLYLGSDMTASQDSRLGRGKDIKIVEQGQSTWQVEAIQNRFRRPLPDQWNAVYAQASLPAEARPAGWDFVFVEGTVLGALGPDLVFQPTTFAQPIRLSIENESEALFYRENLRMLSHSPGLPLHVIARVQLQEPRIAAALAISQIGESKTDGPPHLSLPEFFAGRVCLGFDEIQRHFLVNAQAKPFVLGEPGAPPPAENPLGPLRRRWIATMLAGLACQRPSNSKLLATEQKMLHQNGFTTGAALLDSLSYADRVRGPNGIDSFLATAIYLRICSLEWARSRAMLAG